MKKGDLAQMPSATKPAQGERKFLLSLVIPCYNESKRIELMLAGLADFEEKWKGAYEVIIVDDGSKDGTAEKIKDAIDSKYGQLKERIHVEKMPANGGKGAALKKGVSLAKGDYVLTLDADMSTKPAELINWEKKQKDIFSQTDTIYIGSRKHSEGNIEALKSRKLIGGVFNNIVQVFTTLNLKDTQCGFKLYPGEAARWLFGTMQSKGWAHDVELLYQGNLNDMDIVEMPITWVNQPESKVNVVKDSIMMLIGVVSISLRIWFYNTFVLPFKIPATVTAEQKKHIIQRSVFNTIAVLLILLMPALSFQFAVTGDEHWHFDYGNDILKYFLHGDKAAQTGIPTGAPEGTQPSGIQFYGGIFDVLAASFYYVFHFWSHYKTMHFLNALVGAIGIIFAGKLGKLLGGWGTGILAMLFLVFSPSWFGHNFANPKDIPFSMGYTAGIYYTLLFLRSLPNPGIKYLLGMALSIGWAMGVRIGGLLLIAYLVLFLLSYVVATKQVKVAFSGKIIRQIIVVCVVGYAIAIIFWPYAHLGVFTQPFEALKVMSHFFVNIPILYDGNRMLSNQVPWYYIPRYMAYTMPLIVLAGTVLGLIGVAILYKKNRKLFLFSLFVIFSAVFPLAYAINKHSSLYDGWRHFLFIYPPLVVIAALGWNVLVSSSQKAVSYVAVLLVAAGLALPAKYTFANHPYESLYYNEVAGGLKGIYGKFDTDYYMLGIKDATQWLLKNEHLEGKKVTIGTNTTFPLVAALYEENRKNLPLKYQNVYESNAAFEHREDYVSFAKEHSDFKDAFEPGITYAHYNNRYLKDWDYYIGFSRYLDAATLRAGGWPPEETIYTVKVDGVPIAVVLKRKTKKDLAAFELMKNKRYAEAKEMFLAAVKEYPGNEMAWGQLAKLYEAEGKQDSALFAAQQVLRKNPADMDANQLLGTIYLKQQKVDAAIKFYKSIEQYSPSVSHFFQGYMYAATGNANAAFAELDASIAADPYDQQAYKMAIQIAQQMKDQSRAQEYYEKAQKVFPENEEDK